MGHSRLNDNKRSGSGRNPFTVTMTQYRTLQKRVGQNERKGGVGNTPKTPFETGVTTPTDSSIHSCESDSSLSDDDGATDLPPAAEIRKATTEKEKEETSSIPRCYELWRTESHRASVALNQKQKELPTLNSNNSYGSSGSAFRRKDFVHQRMQHVCSKSGFWDAWSHHSSCVNLCVLWPNTCLELNP